MHVIILSFTTVKSYCRFVSMLKLLCESSGVYVGAVLLQEDEEPTRGRPVTRGRLVLRGRTRPTDWTWLRLIWTCHHLASPSVTAQLAGSEQEIIFFLKIFFKSDLTSVHCQVRRLVSAGGGLEGWSVVGEGGPCSTSVRTLNIFHSQS